jgi:hypothetical protein
MTGEAIADFLLVTLILGGAAAYLVGRSMAITWRPLPMLLVYVLLLCCAVRFIHFALFGGVLLAPGLFVIDAVVLTAIAWLGYRITRAGQMANQYPWLYTRTGPLTWRAKDGSGAADIASQRSAG